MEKDASAHGPKSERLKLETFERFMLAQDRPTNSNTFSFELHLDSTIRVDRLKEAINEVILKHPMASARLDASGDQWMIDWHAPDIHDHLDTHNPSVFDLYYEGGVRIGLRKIADDKHSLIIIVHHACLDALGALQVIGDLAQAYADPLTTPKQSNDSLDFLRRKRSCYGGSRLLSLLRWPFDLVAMIWSYEVFLNRPIPIPVAPAISAKNDGESPQQVATETVRLSQSQSAQVKKAAKSYNQSLNDHLLSVTFLALENWYREFDQENVASLQRIMVPISLRKGAIRSASNMVAMVNLDRRPGKTKSLHWFRKLISFEMTLAKRLRIGVTGNRMLWLLHRIFGNWSLLDEQKKCMSTCVVSNIGNVSSLVTGEGVTGEGVTGEENTKNTCDGVIRFGDAKVTSIDFVGSVGANTHLCFHIFSYLQRLQITATYNPRLLTSEQIDFLLENIVNRMLADGQT